MKSIINPQVVISTEIKQYLYDKLRKLRDERKVHSVIYGGLLDHVIKIIQTYDPSLPVSIESIGGSINIGVGDDQSHTTYQDHMYELDDVKPMYPYGYVGGVGHDCFIIVDEDYENEFSPEE